MQKILITGAGGFLGSRAAGFFRETCRVFTPTHGEMDFSDLDSVRRAMEVFRPDAVIHCGAISDVGACRKDPERAFRINVLGARNMAAASAETGAKCVVCSSDQVYIGSSVQTPHREDEVLSPSNVYGQGKLEAERLCLAENPGCVLLRLSWMYDSRTNVPGEHGDFLRTLMGQLERGETLRYPVHDRRGFTDVNRVVENLPKVLELPGGVYNYGSENKLDTCTLMSRVFRGAGLSVEPEENPEPFRDNPRNLTMDLGKLRGFGIEFPTAEESLTENLRRILA